MTRRIGYGICMFVFMVIIMTNVTIVQAKDFRNLIPQEGPFAEELIVPKHITEEEITVDECDNIDVCRGEVVNTHPFMMPYIFRTRSDKDVVMREFPWTKTYCGVRSDQVVTLKPDSTIYVDGICRNQYKNIWLHATYEEYSGYIYVENILYDFDANLARFAGVVITFRDSLYDGDTLVSFGNTVYPESYADPKHWMDPGSKDILYNTLFRDSCGRYTAETIGNMTYGALGTVFDISEKELLIGSGAANILLSKGKKEDYFAECRYSYCDDPKDIEDVKAGIEYIKNYE